MICFQILVSFTILTGTTTGFVFDTKCAAPPPCFCTHSSIDCYNRNLYQVPVFSRQNAQKTSYIRMELQKNQLTTIPAYAFQNMSAVTTTTILLFLDDNHISSLETHTFSGIENVVTTLALEKNNLTHLPRALADLSSLHTLDLLGNPLVKLDASVLANIGSSLKHLYITVDQFSSFPNELHYLTVLSELKIHNITFPMLDSTVFHSFENSLTTLDMSHANFERIPAAVCRLKALEYFYSDYSPNLGRYSSSIFDECNNTAINVTYLSLQYDQLTTIPKLARIFPRLEYLLLRNNALHFIENSSLAGLTSLTDLDLNNNNLTHIPFAVNMAVNLRHLYIANNQIDTVEDIDLSRLYTLITLSMDDNPIVYVSPFAFAHNPLLFSIDMRSTNIGHLPKAVLGLKHLREVDLRGKPIKCSCDDMNYLKPWNVTLISIYIEATCSPGKSVSTYLTTDFLKCP